MPKVRWVVSYGFCSKFHTLSSSAKILKIGYDLTNLQRVSRWELFLRHSVVLAAVHLQNVSAKFHQVRQRHYSGETENVYVSV